MEREQFIAIMKDEDIKTVFPDGCNALAGLNLIQKYLPKRGVEAAEHDEIYSVDADEICEAGITEEDARKLREMNWGYDDEVDSLYCFV